MNPDSTVKTAAIVASGTSNILNKTNTLINYGFGDYQSEALREEYMNKKTKTFNKKGRDDLIDLYKKNEKIRDEIINFVGDRAGLSIDPALSPTILDKSNDEILDKRYNYSTPNALGRYHLDKFVQSKDNT